MSYLDIIALLPLAYLAVVATPLIIVDVREHRLPNKLVLPFVVLAFITNLVAGIASGKWGMSLIAIGLAVSVLIVGVYLGNKDLLGMGDVKLFVGITLALGYFSTWYGLAIIGITLVLGSILALVAYKVFRRTPSIPMGPFAIGLTAVAGGLVLAGI